MFIIDFLPTPLDKFHARPRFTIWSIFCDTIRIMTYGTSRNHFSRVDTQHVFPLSINVCPWPPIPKHPGTPQLVAFQDSAKPDSNTTLTTPVATGRSRTKQALSKPTDNANVFLPPPCFQIAMMVRASFVGACCAMVRVSASKFLSCLPWKTISARRCALMPSRKEVTGFEWSPNKRLPFDCKGIV